jgi:mono/diheme cytochrome c family protein
MAVLAGLTAALTFTSILLAQSPVERGKAAFIKQQCYRCHGTQGQGGAGARLVPNPPQAAALIAYVRKPKGQMPAYCEKCVSDADLTDIQAYLASLPPPPAAKDLPLLNQ